MKKFLVCALLCAMFGVSTVSAQKIVKETYYGEKANDSMKNPCKGECVTVCAVKEQVVSDLTPGGNGINPYSLDEPAFTTVRTIVKDADGNIIREKTETYEGDVNTVAEKLRMEAIKNGAEVE